MGLDPAEIRRHLSATRLGAQIECLDETDSTNLDAAVAARAGAPAGLVVIADQQRRGRGRQGHSWASPPGVNLYASVLLRPALPTEQIPTLTLVAGVAAAEAIEAAAGVSAGIKWPNDVLLDGKKIAGILTELEIGVDGTPFVVVGIGVNLNSVAGDFPPEVRTMATSILLATGRRVDRAAFAGRLLTALDARYESFLRHGFLALLPAWSERDVLRGRRVRVRSGSGLLDGVAAGLTAEGKLRLQSEGGMTEILAGDVSVVDGYRESVEPE